MVPAKIMLHEIPLMIVIVAQDKEKMKSLVPAKIQEIQNLYIIEIGKVQEGFKK